MGKGGEWEKEEINSSATRECYSYHNFLLCAILVYNFTECVSWEHAALFPDPTHPPHCLQYVRVWVNFSHVTNHMQQMAKIKKSNVSFN